MNAELFQQFRQIAYEKAGIDLRSGKEALVSSRIARRLRELGLATEREYLEHLGTDPSGDELVAFLDAISTNFTSFYREPVHFQLLTQVAQAAVASRQRRLRFWSAASSSGEEPYSMAIALSGALGSAAKDLDLRILATDISTRVLGRAQAGVYTREQVEPVPQPLREQSFERTAQGAFRVKEHLREWVSFRRLNLAQPPFPMQGPLDLVFCRNVMIYFDQTVRERLVQDIERLLRPGGLLLIGHTESLQGLRTGLQLVQPSVYRKPGGSGAVRA